LVISQVSDQYSIGAVVRITGLTSHNIRVWERRHQAVVAHRHPSGRRFYTQDQIDRLLLLKNCIECGFSIGEISKLEDQQLLDKINHPKKQKVEQLSQISVGVWGSEKIIDQLQSIPNLNILFCEQISDYSSIHLHAGTQSKPDIIILDIPSMKDATVSSIQHLCKLNTPALIIVLYRYANRLHLTALRNLGVRLIKAPMDEQSIYFLISDFLVNYHGQEKTPNTPLPNREYPSHLFSNVQLSKISALAPKINCECPHHLSEILKGLKEFERYSGECINENEKDAALHNKIQLTTAQARHQLEILLKEILITENIDI